MKDNYIFIRIESDKKELFKKACDGRSMGLVITRFIDDYIEKEKKVYKNA